MRQNALLCCQPSRPEIPSFRITRDKMHEQLFSISKYCLPDTHVTFLRRGSPTIYVFVTLTSSELDSLRILFIFFFSCILTAHYPAPDVADLFKTKDRYDNNTDNVV